MGLEIGGASGGLVPFGGPPGLPPPLVGPVESVGLVGVVGVGVVGVLGLTPEVPSKDGSKYPGYP